MVINIPNVLTFIRILLTPFVMYFLAHQETRGIALVCFLGAALTDLLDGLTARIFRMATPFGQLFDPVADKILMGGTFVVLAWLRVVPAWYFWLAFGRDVGILLAGSFLLKHSGVDVKALSPSWLGKASTAFQAIIICLLVLSVPLRIAHFLIDISTTLVIASGIQYAIATYQLLAHRQTR